MSPVRKFEFLVTAMLLALSTGLPGGAQAKMPGDLKLRDTTVSKMIVMPKVNPHNQMACSACHPDGRTGSVPGAAAVTDEFLDDDYPDTLCTDCHKEWLELHPNRVDPAKSRQKVSVPANALPLRYAYEGKYLIVCMTCHDVHFPHDANKLLRGYAVNPRRAARFSTRTSFCVSCHGDQFEYLTPHVVRARQTGCTFCHVRKPSAGRPQPLRTSVNALCTYCHPVYPEPHYLSFNPFPDLSLETIYESQVPLRDGSYTCITCHQPHGRTTYPYYLRDKFVELTRVSVRINPHLKGVFCQNCHADPLLSRTNTKVSTRLVEKDVVVLCTRCHAAGKNSGMIHYLGAPPADIKVPANLPLSKDGRITCITCHETGCGPTREDNPKFVRGNPATIRGFCGQCHQNSQPVFRKVHQEYAEGKGCEICHVRPLAAGETIDDKPGDLLADQNFLCMQCHEPDGHPAGFRHTVKPGLLDFVKQDTKIFPLDEFGRITCYSCHQVHQKPGSRKFVRGDDPTCRYCHPY
jgi:hypothetical protein